MVYLVFCTVPFCLLPKHFGPFWLRTCLISKWKQTLNWKLISFFQRNFKMFWHLYFDVPFTPAFVGSRGLYCKTSRTHNLREMDRFYSRLVQGIILKGEASLYHWPPVWLVWNQLYGYWQFLFLFAKQTNPNQSNRRSMVQWYFLFSIPWLVYLLLSVSFSVLDKHTSLLQNQKLYSQHFIFFLTYEYLQQAMALMY